MILDYITIPMILFLIKIDKIKFGYKSVSIIEFLVM